MKEITLGEWGERISSGRYKVVKINYDQGETIILDIEYNINYRVTYDSDNKKLILEEITNE